MASETCASCANTTLTQQWFNLGCNHNVCVACFSKLSVDRGFDPFYRCPVVACHEVSNAWDLCTQKVSVKRLRSGGTLESLYTEVENFQMKDPDISQEPKQYHQTLSADEIQDTCILSITYPNESQTSISCIAAKMKEGINPDKWEEDTKNNTEAIFQVLHGYLFDCCPEADTASPSDEAPTTADTRVVPNTGGADNNQGACFTEDFFGTNARSIEDMATDDATTLLNRCMYALGFGRVVSSQKNSTARWKNLLCQSFAASEIIRNMVNGYGKNSSRLKKKIAGKLISSSASKALWNLLNKIGVSPSQMFINITEDRRGLHAINKGIQLDPHTLVLILYDNIGFRRKGSTPGFEQFTAIQLIVIKKEMLQRWGIYATDSADNGVNNNGGENAGADENDDSENNNSGGENDDSSENNDVLQPPLSRQRLCWEDVRADTSYAQVMGIKSEDDNRLASSVITGIDTILRIEAEGGFPSYEEARQLILDDAAKSEVSWSINMAEENGVRKYHSDANSSQVVTVVTDVSEQENIEGGECHTMLEANNAVVDRPMKADLNAKSTVKSLMNYGLELRSDVLNAPAENETWAQTRPIMRDYGLPLLGDGSPTFAISSILKEDLDHLKYNGKIVGFGGGFHLLLEAHRKRGSLFGSSHLSDIFSTWRTTPGQLKWVLEPGDPNQIDAELIMVVLALYTAATRAEAARRAKVAHDEGLCTFEMSPEDIIDSMVKRALEEPMMLVMLCELRLAELTFMLHEAEKKGSAEIYITAKKYLAVLFAVTHATKYVSMTMDFFRDVFCSSEADKKIFKEAIFVRPTKSGKLIFSDRYVEWMMKDFRTWLGKMASKHTESLLSRCALNLNQRKKERVFDRRETNKEREFNRRETNEPSMELDHIFCEVLTFAVDANLYGDGPLRHVIMGPCRKRNGDTNAPPQNNVGYPYEYNEFSAICCTVQGKEVHLNKEMLSLFSTGQKRLEDYFDTFVKNGDLNNPSRSEKEEGGVSLAAIDPISSAAEKKDRMDLERATSTKTTVIAKEYNVQELKKEIEVLNAGIQELIGNMDNPPPFTQSPITGKKDLLVARVVLLRHKIIELNKMWGRERIEMIQASIDSRAQEENDLIRETMAQEMSHSFYTLKGRTSTESLTSYKFSVNKYYFMDTTSSDDEINAAPINFDDDEDDTMAEGRPSRQSLGVRTHLSGLFSP